jgi:hypothetical protein
MPSLRDGGAVENRLQVGWTASRSNRFCEGDNKKLAADFVEAKNVSMPWFKRERKKVVALTLPSQAFHRTGKRILRMICGE